MLHAKPLRVKGRAFAAEADPRAKPRAPAMVLAEFLDVLGPIV